MALVIADLVQETTSTTGTGTLTLTGAVTGFQTFAAIGNANTTYYRIKSGTDSEVGIGTYTLSGTTLSRDTVLYSSAGGTTKITVAAGATVICTYPAERAVTLVSPVLSGSLADPLLDLAQTWATTGNPTAIKLNVTGSAGGTAKLMDLQVGGASKFSISKTGAITGGVAYGGTTNIFYGETFALGYDSNRAFLIDFYSSPLCVMSSQSYFGFSFNPNNCDRTNNDVRLYRDGTTGVSDGKLALRNSTNAQTFRLYNTYPDSSNWERLSLGFATYSGAIYAKLAVEGGGTSAAANIGIALSPKGTGAITAQVPDGTTAGGNARGANSVDLQTLRSNNTQVASGNYSVVIGVYNKSTVGGVAIGNTCISTGNTAVAIGNGAEANGYGSVALGRSNIVSSTSNDGVALGYYGSATINGQVAIGFGLTGTLNVYQSSSVRVAGNTTDATLTTLTANTQNITLPNNNTWAVDIDIVARTNTAGGEHGCFKRRCLIRRGANAGATALIGAVQTPALDIGTTNILAIPIPITISADTTNGALKIEVTGIAATNIRWFAKVSLVEVGYA